MRDRQEVSSVRVAAATITPSLDPSETRGRIRAIVEDTMHTWPDVRVIHFGEVILGWFAKKGQTADYHRSIAEPIPGPSTGFVADLARKHAVYISFGLTERAGEALYNTQVLVSPEGNIVATHRKFRTVIRVFTPGPEVLTTVKVDGLKIALLVCADVRSLRILRAIRKEKVDLVLAALADHGEDSAMSKMIGAFFDAWAMTANRFGGEDSIQWHGLTTITDRWGRLVRSSIGRETVLVQDIPLAQTAPAGRQLRRMLVFFKSLALVISLSSRALWTHLKADRRTTSKSR